MYIIFPFETAFYKKHSIAAEYRGNPLVDEVEHRVRLLPCKKDLFKELGLGERPVIALLAGSRRHEVESILPIMIKVISYFPEYQFVLAGVKNLSGELYMGIIKENQIKLVIDKTYEVLSVSDAAIVTSGTATLEAALFNVPQVVCYKGDFFSMLIAWIVIKVKYISLVNLIADSEVVRELLMYDVNVKNILKELRSILPGGEKREEILRGYMAVKEELGPAGASGRIAGDMVKVLMGR
jgi:lipid-A-disaccharide synthase